MKVTPLTCALGAEISGIRLAEAATNADLGGALEAALLQYKVLFPGKGIFVLAR